MAGGDFAGSVVAADTDEHGRPAAGVFAADSDYHAAVGGGLNDVFEVGAREAEGRVMREMERRLHPFCRSFNSPIL